MFFSFKPLNPCLKLNDGSHVSVQASSTHHCSPQSDYGPYSEFEINTSAKKRYLSPYKQDCGTHSYVPVQLILRLIEESGGIAEGEVPPHFIEEYEPREEYYAYRGEAKNSIIYASKSDLKQEYISRNEVAPFEEWIDCFLAERNGIFMREFDFEELTEILR